MSIQIQSPFYVGTYTGGKSQGIYKYELSPNGNLTRVGLVAKAENPSFLTFNNKKNVLLSVNENEEGTISSYAINPDGLELISMNNSGGSYPCFVSTNENNFVLTANYGSGSVGLLQLNTSGKLSDLLDVDQHEGKGTTDRQEGPHAHSAWFAEDNKVISVDLGTNDLWFSTLNSETKNLEPHEPRTVELDPGAGPRHLAFYPGKKWLFVLSELNNKVTRFIMKDGNYVEANSVSILDEDFTGESMGADIHISADGRFMYASTRGSDTIAIIEIAEDGKLEFIDQVSTHGRHPRNFKLSPDENFLVVANKDSDNLVSFKRNAETGMLTYVSEVSAPNPVCVLFE